MGEIIDERNTVFWDHQCQTVQGNWLLQGTQYDSLAEAQDDLARRRRDLRKSGNKGALRVVEVSYRLVIKLVDESVLTQATTLD